jgi:hypothetical protein
VNDEALPPPPPLDRIAPPDAEPPPMPVPATVEYPHTGWKPRPLLGPTLWAYGVGLWAFVALGQFTTKYAPWSSTVPLGGGAAAFWLFAISLAGLVHALRSSFALPSDGWTTGKRSAFVAIVVPVLWVITGVFSALVSSSGSDFDAFMTIALLALAITTTVLGRASTRTLSPAPQGRTLAVVIGLWAASGVFTLLVLLQLG